MNDKQINSLIGILYSISAIMVLLGTFYKLQHHSYGLTILIIGFMLGTAISSFDTFRLKKKIKRLEEHIKEHKNVL